jgi:Phytanoyl-CoA dioxygenase (PhyH)
MQFKHSNFTVGHPTLIQRILDKIRHKARFNAIDSIPALDDSQTSIVNNLKKDGYVILPKYIESEKLKILNDSFKRCLDDLKFNMPCLAQNKIDPIKHASFINNHMLATPDVLSELGVAFDQHDCKNYQQVVNTFKPSTLTVHMLQYSKLYCDIWLDPYLLPVISYYMGLVPQLTESYVRRNFPAKYKNMNHYWHRDLNHHSYLLKVFIFFSDCDEKTGPHEYIKGSCTDKNKLNILNDQRYYKDSEIDAKYPPDGEDRILSIVPAGTVVIEDTRGLHRANIPVHHYRDLGYAVYTPVLKSSPAYYKVPENYYRSLSTLQKLFVPDQCISN